MRRRDGEKNDYTFKRTVDLTMGDLKACAVDEDPTKSPLPLHWIGRCDTVHEIVKILHIVRKY